MSTFLSRQSLRTAELVGQVSRRVPISKAWHVLTVEVLELKLSLGHQITFSSVLSIDTTNVSQKGTFLSSHFAEGDLCR